VGSRKLLYLYLFWRSENFVVSARNRIPDGAAIYRLSYCEQSFPLNCTGKRKVCMLQCAHVVSADTPGISRPARVRFVQRGNRRCDTAPSISCHVPSKRRSTEGPSLGPDYTVVQCYCHCREQLTGTQGRLLQVCSCNTDNGSASGAAHFRTFVRAMFSGILFKGLLFEARQLHTRFKYLCSLHYTTHTQTHTIHTAMSESATLTCHIQRDVQNA